MACHRVQTLVLVKRRKKDRLENGAHDIAVYWSELTFNGHPVVPLPVNCDGRPGDFLKSATAITNFIATPLRDIR